MNDFLNLSFDLQIMLFAGYITYFLTRWGQDTKLETHDVVFRVVGFGASILAVWEFLKALLIGHVGQWEWVVTFQTPLKLLGFITFACGLAYAWSKIGKGLFKRIVRSSGFSMDDGTPSALQTLKDINAPWHFVSVYTVNGPVLTCMLGLCPDEGLATEPVTYNNDGILMHVTHSAKCAGADDQYQSVGYDAARSVIQYIPMSQIVRLEIGLYSRSGEKIVEGVDWPYVATTQAQQQQTADA